MTETKKTLKWGLAGLLAALTCAGCTTTVKVYQYQYDATLDEVFVKQGVDLRRYDAVMIDPISVWYPDEFAPSPENAGKAKENLARAQDLFRKTIADALPNKYTVTDTPGRNVLRLHVEFIDLRAADGEATLPAELSRYEFETRPGHITLVGELLDSNSGEQLARAADLGKQPSAGGNGVVDWDAIASDFRYWADVFSAWMDREQQTRD